MIGAHSDIDQILIVLLTLESILNHLILNISASVPES